MAVANPRHVDPNTLEPSNSELNSMHFGEWLLVRESPLQIIDVRGGAVGMWPERGAGAFLAPTGSATRTPLGGGALHIRGAVLSTARTRGLRGAGGELPHGAARGGPRHVQVHPRPGDVKGGEGAMLTIPLATRHV
eukprot:853678-Prorocentrum_minimum.AAC.4